MRALRTLLPLSVFLLTSASVLGQGVVKSDTWWLPKDASEHGHQVDSLFDVIFVVTGISFVLVQAVLVYLLVKYRYRKGRKAKFIHGHHKAEVIWTLTPAVLLLVMGILSIRAWAQIRTVPPDPAKEEITEIEILAQQFQWNVRYAGKDGKFGTMDDIGSFAGLYGPGVTVPTDDEREAVSPNYIRVPVGRTVRVHLMSRDVLHSFFVPNMRQKMDAVPGLRGQLWFKPVETGEYEIYCAELCGPQHYSMRGALKVLPVEEFDEWVEEYYSNNDIEVYTEPEEGPADEEDADEAAMEADEGASEEAAPADDENGGDAPVDEQDSK